MSTPISEKYTENDRMPRTYLEQNGHHIRLDLSREQLLEFEERGVHMETIKGGGILIDCSRSGEAAAADESASS